MDKNLLLLVLLGSAIVFFAGSAVYKAWFDNKTKRNKLAKLAREITAVQHGDILSGRYNGFAFTAEYHEGYDEYEMPGMRITFAATFPATLFICKNNSLHRIMKKIVQGTIFKTGDSTFDQQWSLFSPHSGFFQQWFEAEEHRGLVDKLMHTGCSVVKMEKTAVTVQWYTLKPLAALSLMESQRIKNALDILAKIVFSLTALQPVEESEEEKIIP